MSSVVSVHALSGTLAGTGVVVTTELILTCAHVLNAALGRREKLQSRPAETAEVDVRFNADPSVKLRARLDPGEDAWRAPPATSGRGADLCLLRLAEPLPHGTSVARLRREDFNQPRSFLAKGYPADWNSPNGSHEIDAAVGQVLCFAGHLLLLRADASPNQSAWGKLQRPSGAIYKGFSGGPVEVDGSLVGLIAQARENLYDATAYAIPALYFPARLGSVVGHRNCDGQDVRQNASRLEQIKHLPPGPGVDPYTISFSFRRLFSAGTNEDETHETIRDANGTVLSLLDDKPDNLFAHIISRSELPEYGKVSPDKFWGEVLNRACSLGPRMLGAIVLAAPDRIWAGRENERSDFLRRLGENK